MVIKACLVKTISEDIGIDEFCSKEAGIAEEMNVVTEVKSFISPQPLGYFPIFCVTYNYLSLSTHRKLREPFSGSTV